jgi:hypothetical protein
MKEEKKQLIYAARSWRTSPPQLIIEKGYTLRVKFDFDIL